MQAEVIIIGEGNLGKFISNELNDINPESFSAKKFYLEENYNNQINDILLCETLDRLKTGEKILFTGRKGLLLDKLIEKLNGEYSEFKENFVLSGVNGVEDFGDIQRLTLNAKINKDGAKEFDTSYLYSENINKELIEVFKKINLNIEIISDKDEFLKYFFSKALLNVIVNSSSILFFQNISKSYYSLLNMYNYAYLEENKTFIKHIELGLIFSLQFLEEEDISTIFELIGLGLTKGLLGMGLPDSDVKKITKSFTDFGAKYNGKTFTKESIDLVINNLENDLIKYRGDFIKEQFIKEFNLYISKYNNIEINKDEFFKYLNNAISIIGEDYPSSFYQHWGIDTKDEKSMSFNKKSNKYNSDMEFMLEKITNLAKTPLLNNILRDLKSTKTLPDNLIGDMFNGFLSNIEKEKKEVEGFYNDTSYEYNNTFGKPAEYIDNFINLIPENSSVLDLGCGNGINSNYLHEKGFNVVGIDLSENFIEKNKENFPGVNFFKSDMISDDLGNNAFDGVFSSFSIIHIEKKEVRNILKKINDSLKNGGIFYLSLQEYFIGNEKDTNSPLNKDKNIFINSFSYYEIMDILEQSGFEILEKYKRGAKESELNFNKLFIIARKM